MWWNIKGRYCVVTDTSIDSQNYQIQIEKINGKYIVPKSSLQIARKFKNLQNGENFAMDQYHSDIFDQQKNILDDITYALYIKKFWNFTELHCHWINNDIVFNCVNLWLYI